jgi:uncharacterized protein YggE
MLKIFICLGIAISLVLPTTAATPKDDATKIMVSGNGIIKVEADLSYVSVAIEKTEKTATQAQQKAAETMKNVLSALRNTGIPKDKIQTTSFRLDPKYKYDKREKTLVGYTAKNQIRVTLDDLGKVGKIIDTAISAGANRVSNIAFTVKDDAPHKKAALKKAFNNAREKAKTIAAASGLIIKRIKMIKEAGAEVIRPFTGVQAFKAEGEAVETPIIPGKVEVRGSLTVVYECVK